MDNDHCNDQQRGQHDDEDLHEGKVRITDRFRRRRERKEPEKQGDGIGDQDAEDGKGGIGSHELVVSREIFVDHRFTSLISCFSQR